jgi:hypothetical protein
MRTQSSSRGNRFASPQFNSLLALHELPDMGADLIRKALKVVTAFEHRHEAAFAVLLR